MWESSGKPRTRQSPAGEALAVGARREQTLWEPIVRLRGGRGQPAGRHAAVVRWPDSRALRALRFAQWRARIAWTSGCTGAEVWWGEAQESRPSHVASRLKSERSRSPIRLGEPSPSGLHAVQRGAVEVAAAT